MIPKQGADQLLIGITGATGFIGRYLSQQFQSEFQVRSLVRIQSKMKLEQVPNGVLGDLADLASIRSFLSGRNTVIHLANSNFPRDSQKSLSEDLALNLGYTLNLFETFSQTNPDGHLLFFSSGGAVYDPYLAHLPRKESDRTAPISSYGIQKLAAEHFLSSICAKSGLRATIFRVSNPFGTLLSQERAQGIVGVAMACVKNNRPFRLFGSPSTVRDYIHLSDLLSATRQAMLLKPETGKCRVYNVGSGVGVRSDDLLTTIERVAGKKLDLTKDDAGNLEPDWNVLDISKIEHELGWKPQVEFIKGLKMTYEST